MLRRIVLVSFTFSAGVVVSHAVGCGRAPEPGAVKADPSTTPKASAESAAPPSPSPAPSPSEVVTADPTPPAKPAKPLSTAECNKLWDHAQKTDAAAYAAASKACSANTDCEAVHVRACLADCNSAAIAKSASTAYEKVRATIEATDCKTWFDGSCVTATPMPVPSCPMYVPICAGGKCATKTGP